MIMRNYTTVSIKVDIKGPSQGLGPIALEAAETYRKRQSLKSSASETEHMGQKKSRIY